MTVNDLVMKMVWPNSNCGVKYIDINGDELDKLFPGEDCLVYNFYVRDNVMVVVCKDSQTVSSFNKIDNQ